MSGETDPASPSAARPAGDGTPAEAARRLLARARRATPNRRTTRRDRPDEQPWSSARPDDRDPAPLGRTVDDLIRQRRWVRTLDAASLQPRWADIVGADLAAHCRPERLADGELVCVAESTAWATAVRLMSAQLLTRIAAEVGPDVVRRLRVQGPTAPDWRHGPLRVTGRGPRDTYG